MFGMQDLVVIRSVLGNAVPNWSELLSAVVWARILHLRVEAVLGAHAFSTLHANRNGIWRHGVRSERAASTDAILLVFVVDLGLKAASMRLVAKATETRADAFNQCSFVLLGSIVELKCQLGSKLGSFLTAVWTT